MERAYSFLQVKSFDSERRTIKGIATTPTPDRVGDIVEPKGVKVAAEIPLLWQHEHDKPVGLVRFSSPTDKGIEFEAHLPIIEEAGALKDRVDEAWQSIKLGLVRAVSIGFRTLENGVERLKEGGLRFTKTEVIELSLVTIPANSQAVITAIKAIDRASLSASGQQVEEVDTTPGASGQTKQANRGPVKLIQRKRN